MPGVLHPPIPRELVPPSAEKIIALRERLKKRIDGKLPAYIAQRIVNVVLEGRHRIAWLLLSSLSVENRKTMGDECCGIIHLPH